MPTWIKKELKDSASGTGENDDEDDGSDVDVNSEENDLTLASIKINKDINALKGIYFVVLLKNHEDCSTLFNVSKLLDT